ncbi:hypothetical protein HGQ17_11610 [Nesterenkonia sp. MY13]|uniref:Uncharacterized protein n=1 Tax=Nesterenkonia sedimenti TaxID=1463632 RepID=A0A7X8TKS9_9MICC|nr:hypothetical protein [Nesterenkonia sedimenti]NLS10625.1 hypothetical protein [Nesterenkonia sedimenti]
MKIQAVSAALGVTVLVVGCSNEPEMAPLAADMVIYPVLAVENPECPPGETQEDYEEAVEEIFVEKELTCYVVATDRRIEVTDAEVGITEVENSTQDALLLHLGEEEAEAYSDLSAELSEVPYPDNLTLVTVDGQFFLAPTVNAHITDGQMEITGNDDPEDLHRTLTE